MHLFARINLCTLLYAFWLPHRYDAQRAVHDRVLSAATTLAELLQREVPPMPEIQDDSQEMGGVRCGIVFSSVTNLNQVEWCAQDMDIALWDRSNLNMMEDGEVGLFGDEVTHQFYKNFPCMCSWRAAFICPCSPCKLCCSTWAVLRELVPHVLLDDGDTAAKNAALAAMKSQSGAMAATLQPTAVRAPVDKSRGTLDSALEQLGGSRQPVAPTPQQQMQQSLLRSLQPSGTDALDAEDDDEDDDDDGEGDAGAEGDDDGTGEPRLSLRALREQRAAELSTASADLNASQKAKFDALLTRLPTLGSKESVDEFAMEFVYTNTKYTRSKLLNSLFEMPRHAMEMLPPYARLVAILNAAMSGYAKRLVENLQVEFRYLVKKKKQTGNHPLRRTWNVRFMGELTKFGVAPPGIILNYIHVRAFRHIATASSACPGKLSSPLREPMDTAWFPLTTMPIDILTRNSSMISPGHRSKRCLRCWSVLEGTCSWFRRRMEGKLQLQRVNGSLLQSCLLHS